MARGDVSSASSPDLDKQGSAAAHLLGVVLLALCLVVTGWGLVTAIYLDRLPSRSHGPATAPAPSALATLPPAAPSDRTETASAPPAAPAASATLSGPAEPSPALTTLEPQSGDGAVSSPPPVAAAPALPAPRLAAPAAPAPSLAAASPPAVRAEPRYWVEYAVYVKASPARRLQQLLAKTGLSARLVKTRTPDGRSLVRVRSAPLASAEARAAAERAAALGIVALLHRSAPAIRPETRRYWVQFGAFPHRPAAKRLKTHLGQGGIATTVSATRGSSGKSLFLVRSLPLPDRASAVALGERAERMTRTGFLVGEHRPPSSSRRHARAPPARAAAGATSTG
jgi:cell division protein FtsN